MWSFLPRGAVDAIAGSDEGGCEGRKPYGHRPGEAKVIARIKQLPDDSLVLEKIADQLNAEAIPARAGKL